MINCKVQNFQIDADTGKVQNFQIDADTGDIRAISCIDRDTEYKDGPAVFNVIAENADRNIMIKCKVQNFQIDADTGEIRAISCIDRDTEYKDGPAVFNVIAENADRNPDQTDIVQVTVQIEDLNDNSPVFDPDKYVESIEFLEADQYITTVTATDADKDMNGDVFYLFDDNQENEIIFEYFRIDKNTGDIHTRKVEFPEEPSEYLINVQAFDKGSPSNEDDALVQVIVGNLKDPYFKPEDRSQRLELIEGDPEACAYIKLPLFNTTLGVLYEIVSSTGNFRLRCLGNDPQLCTNRALDREDTDGYAVMIQAFSSAKLGCSVGEPEPGTEVAIQSNQAILEVVVGDVNDEVPEFQFDDYLGALGNKYYIGIADDAQYGTSVFNIQVIYMETRAG
ncbi:protocadherin alpha-3-like [Amphiura filiformis]|uniref:protocadherin alpha-3-like n=1 Tax=Amphiura filiformis TaxID=82378 RepID=UPI003B21F9CD